MNEQITAVKSENDVLVLDATEKSLVQKVSVIESEAEVLNIRTTADFQNACDLAGYVKKMQKKITDYWEPMRVSTKRAYDDVLAHKKEMLTPLKSAEQILKSKIADYSVMQEEKQRKREEEIKKLAQKEIEKNLTKAIECQKSGDITGAKAAMAEAEVMNYTANSSISVASKPKADGVSMNRAWKIVSVDDSKVPIDINGAVIRPVDQSAIMALIKATKGKIDIPGVVYEETVSVSVRSK